MLRYKPFNITININLLTMNKAQLVAEIQKSLGSDTSKAAAERALTGSRCHQRRGRSCGTVQVSARELPLQPGSGAGGASLQCCGGDPGAERSVH